MGNFMGDGASISHEEGCWLVLDVVEKNVVSEGDASPIFHGSYVHVVQGNEI